MKKLIALGLTFAALILVVGVIIHFHEPMHSMTNAAMQATPVVETKQLWTCGMHPQVIQDHPGDCPICHMKLTPLKASDTSAASATDAGPGVHVDPAVVQSMGIRTAEVTRGPMTVSIRVVGVLEAPETGLHDISPKVGGWIEKLYANQDGMHVHKGEPLFDLYSPDLLVAEQELIGAVKSARLDPSSSAMLEAAKNKLRLLDVSEEDINAIASKQIAPKSITFRSPASGAVIDKSVVEGSAIQAGQKLMRIEDHSSLWLQLQVYEDQMSQVTVGQEVEAAIDGVPGKTFGGKISFIHPHIDHMSRTVTVRAELGNPEQSLHPGMYGSATILTQPNMNALQVPREAVIDTGNRQIVFVAMSEGHFDPRTVRTGMLGDDGRVEIISGLTPGEQVVTSGEFLLDVESRTQEVIAKLRSSSSPPAPATVSVAFCPMKKAHWLQHGSIIANPYFGSQMIDCGEVQRTVTVADGNVQPVLDAYLHVESALAGDKVDKDAVAAMQTAAHDLPGDKFSNVKAAADAVAGAGDIAAARSALIPLSEALRHAVEGGRP